MALIFAAIAAVGALNAPTSATPDTLWTAQAPPCRTARITARADLVYKPDASSAPIQDKAVVVMMEQMQRSSDTGASATPSGETPADATRDASMEPARLLICAPGHQGRQAGA